MSGMVRVIIYVLVSTAKVGLCRYVGKALDKKQRLREHLRPSSDSSKPLREWIAGVLRAGHELLALPLDGDEANWVAREKYWIKKLRAEGHPLLNQSEGGDVYNACTSTGMKGKKHGPQAKKKISDASRLRNADPAHRAKSSATMTRLNADPDFVARRSAARRRLNADPDFVASRIAGLRRYWARRRAEA